LTIGDLLLSLFRARDRFRYITVVVPVLKEISGQGFSDQAILSFFPCDKFLLEY